LPVTANLFPWNLEPGQWVVTQGIDSLGEGLAHDLTDPKQVELDRDRPLSLTFAPRTTTVISLKLVSKGTPYWSRPDLGIGKDDVVSRGRQIMVTVHSLGGVDGAATKVALMDANGKVSATVNVPILKAPLDLMPKTAKVILRIPAGANVKGGSVVLDPDRAMKEITRVNNQVKLN
jgi:hypothetical protein